jgi:hypothetical protein
VVHVREPNAWHALAPGEVAVYAIDYRFSDATGIQRFGVAYETLREDTTSSLHPGDRLPVEYLTAQPAISRLSGMRRTTSHGWLSGIIGLLILLFLLLFFYWPHTRRERLRNFLLQQGVPAPGHRRGIKNIENQREGQPAAVLSIWKYRMEFTFLAEDGQRYHFFLYDNDYERYGTPLYILYDPRNPAQATALPPITVRTPYCIDDAGNFQVTWNWGMLWVVIPLAVSCGYACLGLQVIWQFIMAIAGLR